MEGNRENVNARSRDYDMPTGAAVCAALIKSSPKRFAVAGVCSSRSDERPPCERRFRTDAQLLPPPAIAPMQPEWEFLPSVPTALFCRGGKKGPPACAAHRQKPFRQTENIAAGNISYRASGISFGAAVFHIA